VPRTEVAAARASCPGSTPTERNPDSGVRNLPFGVAGMITYLVVEHERRVDILLVTWTGPSQLS
jgi:hypothetical protein